jgi:hypothetical protein
MLEIGGLKRVPINDHSVGCNFQLPNTGGDLAPMADADARTVRDELGLQIVGPSYTPCHHRAAEEQDDHW